MMGDGTIGVVFGACIGTVVFGVIQLWLFALNVPLLSGKILLASVASVAVICGFIGMVRG